MRLSLVTLNFGNVLCANARESFKDAAARWGASYVELTAAQGIPGVRPTMTKTFLFDIVDVDRVFYVDGSDVIIRRDTPSPFQECPPEELGVVKNAFPRVPNYRDILKHEDREWGHINKALGEHIMKGDRFFNAGVMVLTRRTHQELLMRAREIHKRIGEGLGWGDQTFINYAAVEMKRPIRLMDETWNYIHPEQVGTWDRMERYIYHFAGDHENRKIILPYLAWRVSVGGTPKPNGLRSASLFDDTHWADTAAFIRKNLNEEERILALGAFEEKFPGQTCGYYTQPHPSDFTWAVFHKGMMEDVGEDLLASITANFRPVFANEVFVVFSRRAELPRVQGNSPHLMSFYERVDERQREAEKIPPGFTQRFYEKAKDFLRRRALLVAPLSLRALSYWR